jgi:hypothetical protein
MELKGKVVVVTGGASGIGAAMARRFAKAGAAGIVGKGIRVSCLCPQGVRTPMLMGKAGGRKSFLQDNMVTPEQVADDCLAARRGTLPRAPASRGARLPARQGCRCRALAGRHAAAAGEVGDGLSARIARCDTPSRVPRAIQTSLGSAVHRIRLNHNRERPAESSASAAAAIANRAETSVSFFSTATRELRAR